MNPLADPPVTPVNRYKGHPNTAILNIYIAANDSGPIISLNLE